jgi:hypothetical protein
MKCIIENNEDILKVRRRLPELKNLIQNLFSYLYPCDYDSLLQYMMAIKIDLLETTILVGLEDVDSDLIWDVITELYSDVIVENYIYNCKEQELY